MRRPQDPKEALQNISRTDGMNGAPHIPWRGWEAPLVWPGWVSLTPTGCPGASWMGSRCLAHLQVSRWRLAEYFGCGCSLLARPGQGQRAAWLGKRCRHFALGRWGESWQQARGLCARSLPTSIHANQPLTFKKRFYCSWADFSPHSEDFRWQQSL